MNEDRRKVLKSTGGMAVMGLALAAGLFKPGSAWAQAWNKDAFATKDMAGTVKALGGTTAAESKDIVITSPDIAENGAVVPFTISSNLPKTESIALLVEKNPFPLLAHFTLSNGAEGYVNTRFKAGQSSVVKAVVKAGGKTYVASREVKVTIGGCGG